MMTSRRPFRCGVWATTLRFLQVLGVAGVAANVLVASVVGGQNAVTVLVAALPFSIALAGSATIALGRSYMILGDDELSVKVGASFIQISDGPSRLLVPRQPGPLGPRIIIESEGARIALNLVGQGAFRTPRRLQWVVRECRKRSIDCEWIESGTFR